MGKSL
jgi:hypothetical protein